MPGDDLMSEGVPIDKRVVLINSASAVLNRLIGITVLIWLQQYLVRRISAEEYGLYQVVLALLVFVPLVAAVVASGLARFTTEAYARHDQERVTQIASTTAVLCGIGALLILMAGAVMVWQIDHLISVGSELTGDARWMLGLLTVIAAVRMLSMPFGVGMHVRQKFVWMHVIALSAELVRLGLLFFLLFGVSIRVLWVVVASVPSTMVEVVAAVIVSRRLVPALRFERHAVSRELARPLVAFGGWTLTARLAVGAREAAGPLLLNHFAGAVAVTAYSLGTLVESRLFPNLLQPLLAAQPVLTAMHATGQRVRMRLSYFRLTRYLLWTFLAVAAPLIVYRGELWSLYLGSTYSSYAVATLVMAVVLVKVVILFPQPALAQIAAAKDRTRPVGLRVLAVEGTAVLLSVYLVVVRGWGAMGPAIAVLVSSVVLGPLLLWRIGLELTEATFSDWWRATLRPGLLPTIAGLPVWLALNRFARPASWVELGLCAAAGGVAYLAVLLAFCLQEDDREDAGRVLAAVVALWSRGAETEPP